MIRDIIKKEIEKAVKKFYKKDVDFDVSADGRHGDYFSNAAMVIGGNPKENAARLKSELEKFPYVSKIEIAGPGFLNFTLSKEGLMEGLKNLSAKSKKKRGKIQVEFISVNPTGELHIGHGRSAFFGDALANVLEAAGYKAEREHFINDSKESAQIKELGKTVLGKGGAYLTDYLKLKIKKLQTKNYKLKTESEAGYQMAQEIQKDNQEFIAKKLGIKFDRWFSEERELRKKKAFEKALELLKKKNLVYEKEGALWAKTSKFGDEEDRVAVRSDGSVGYFLSDIAYHINKFARKYAKIIDIWGADHQGHVKRMLAMKKALAWKGDLEILISQMVTLKKGEELRKLSKRKGDIILLKDLVEDLGLDATRWFYLQKSLSTHMEFDMDLAKERSQKNPVYYVQYAGARMASILARSREKTEIFSGSSIYKYINDPTVSPTEKISVFSLCKKLIQFLEVVEDTAKDYQVHRLTTYAYELANEFSQFYRDVKVIGSENEKELLALVVLTRKTLADTLKLLGISAPEKM